MGKEITGRRVSEIKIVAHKGIDKEGGREGMSVEERERE